MAERSKAVGLRPLACWDCGFECHWGHGCVVYCECCVLLGRVLCDELITRPEEFYRLWYVVECDLETSWMRRSWPTGGCLEKKMLNRLNALIFTKIWTVILWDMPPWILADIHQSFGQTFDFDLQGRGIKGGSKFVRNYVKHRISPSYGPVV